MDHIVHFWYDSRIYDIKNIFIFGLNAKTNFDYTKTQVLEILRNDKVNHNKSVFKSILIFIIEYLINIQYDANSLIMRNSQYYLKLLIGSKSWCPKSNSNLLRCLLYIALLYFESIETLYYMFIIFFTIKI